MLNCTQQLPDGEKHEGPLHREDPRRPCGGFCCAGCARRLRIPVGQVVQAEPMAIPQA